MTSPACPICEAPVRAARHNEAFPFCSKRCKLIDLGNWLGERYRIAEDDAPTIDVHVPGKEES